MKYKNYHSFPRYFESEKVYCGCVEDVPEIPEIEAETLEEYERLFQRSVDDYIIALEKSKAKRRRGLIFALLSVVGIAFVMFLSCPKKEQHLETITEIVLSLASEQADPDIVALGRMFGNPITTGMIKAYVNVDDYYLVSVGRIDYDGRKTLLSVGAFGHIFTAPKKRIRQQIEQNEDLRDILELFQ